MPLMPMTPMLILSLADTTGLLLARASQGSAAVRPSPAAARVDDLEMLCGNFS